MSCGVITMGHAADCDNLPAQGTRARAIVFNYDDIESYTEAGGKITAITLKAGKFGYEFSGLPNATGFLESQDSGRSAVTGLNRFKHKHTLIIFERTQAQKDNIKQLGNGRFVVALFLRGTDADSIVLAGKDVGVQLTAGEIQNAYSNDGFFVLNMATPEGDTENETALMQSIWITDYPTTVAMLEALLPTS